MFDPSIGRWLEMDPIAFDAGDANLYRAMGNNPTNRSDPSGLLPNIAQGCIRFLDSPPNETAYKEDLTEKILLDNAARIRVFTKHDFGDVSSQYTLEGELKHYSPIFKSDPAEYVITQGNIDLYRADRFRNPDLPEKKDRKEFEFKGRVTSSSVTLEVWRVKPASKDMDPEGTGQVKFTNVTPVKPVRIESSDGEQYQYFTARTPSGSVVVLLAKLGTPNGKSSVCHSASFGLVFPNKPSGVWAVPTLTADSVLSTDYDRIELTRIEDLQAGDLITLRGHVTGDDGGKGTYDSRLLHSMAVREVKK